MKQEKKSDIEKLAEIVNDNYAFYSADDNHHMIFLADYLKDRFFERLDYVYEIKNNTDNQAIIDSCDSEIEMLDKLITNGPF